MKTLTMIDAVPVASVVYYYDHVKNGDSHTLQSPTQPGHRPQTPILALRARYTSRVRFKYRLRVVRHYLLLIISLRRDAGEKPRRVKKGLYVSRGEVAA